MGALIEKSAGCPYCGERIQLLLDASAGEAQEYIEDCAVCCQPMTVSFAIVNGHVRRLTVSAD
jgi:cysteine-rich CPXCG protein